LEARYLVGEQFCPELACREWLETTEVTANAFFHP